MIRIYLCLIDRSPEQNGMAVVAAQTEFAAARMLRGDLEDANLISGEQNSLDWLRYNMREVGTSDGGFPEVLRMLIPGVDL